MSGTITNTDIHYTDDIGQDTTLWVVNNKISKHVWAQTNDKMFNRYVYACTKVGTGTIAEVNTYSINSKWRGGWNDNNKTWESYNDTDRTEIIFSYMASMDNVVLKRNTGVQPFNTKLSLIDNFDLTKFLPFIRVDYDITYDSVNEEFIITTGAYTRNNCDLKTYLDDMSASGLTENEYFLRYPIRNFYLIGYYGDTGNRIALTNSMGSSAGAGFTIQSESKVGNSINATFRSFSGAPSATNSEFEKACDGLGTVATSRNRNSVLYSEYNLTTGDYIVVFDDNTQKVCHNCDFVEITIKDNDSMFDENDKLVPKQFLSDDLYKIPINAYASKSGGNENIKLLGFYTPAFIMHYCALFGTYFTTDETLVQTDLTQWYNIPKNVFLGHMDNNGWTDGTYAEGSAIKDFDSANKQINDINDTPYNPNSNPENTDNLDNDVFGSNVQYASFSRKYLLTGLQLNSLYSVINSSADFKVKDGMQYFVSLQKIPQLFAENCICSTELIKFGDFPDPLIYSDHVDGSRVDYAIGQITAGSIDVPQRYNNFLDFYPYTRHKLYLPYIGVVDLPPDLAGKHLNIKYSWDIENGNCTAYVTVATETGQSVFATYSGNIYGDIVVTANNADIKQIKQALSLASGVNGMFSGAMSLNPFSIIGATINTLQTDVDTESKGFFHTKSSQGDFNSFHAPQYCKLITQYMYVDDFTPFEISTGYNCNKWTKLSDMHGRTVVQNPNVGSSFLTVDEINELNRLLERGVILP